MLNSLKKFFVSLFKETPKPRRRSPWKGATDIDFEAESTNMAMLSPGQNFLSGVQWHQQSNAIVAECHTCHSHVVFMNGIERDRSSVIFEHCNGKRRDRAPRSIRAFTFPRVALSV
jgi:hypothetical protein